MARKKLERSNQPKLKRRSNKLERRSQVDCVQDGTAADAAAWMFDEVRNRPYLAQESAASWIKRCINPDLVEKNANDNLSIKAAVRELFRELHQDSVKWISPYERNGGKHGRWYMHDTKA